MSVINVIHRLYPPGESVAKYVLTVLED